MALMDHRTPNPGNGSSRIRTVVSDHVNVIKLRRIVEGAQTCQQTRKEHLFIVRRGRIVTPPISAGALEGITRDSVMTIARDLGYEVEIGDVLRSDLYTCDEAFLTGTAAEVVPIRSVDDREVGEPGPITRAVQETYFATVRGEVDRYKDWVEHVG